MPPIDSIFRPFRTSDAERSDRSAGDRLRHRQKCASRSATTSPTSSPRSRSSARDRDRIIKVPIRGIKEYRFVYGDNAPGVGQGDGDIAAAARSSARPAGRRRRARPTSRRPARRRLLRDRRHARRADRHHVRGSRAARPRAQGAARDRGRRARPSARATARSASAFASTSAAPSARASSACTPARHRSRTDRDARPAADTERALPVPRRRPDLPATSPPTYARSPTPWSSASWTPRARWTR